MTRLKQFAVTVVILVLVVVCSGPAQADKTIKIGALFEMTGFLAPIGKDAKQGAMIAIEQQGGKLLGANLEFIIEDSATDVPTAMDKTRKLVEVDKVRIIVGPIFGSCTAAMGGYSDKVHVPLISIAPLSADNMLKNKWTFSATGTNQSVSYPMGVFAAKELGYKTATTLASDFDAGHEFIEGFALGFKAKGGKLIQQQWSPPGTTNMMPYLVAVKGEADCLVAWWAGAEVFAGYKQYKELNLKMPLLQPEDGGITGNPVAVTHLGDAAVGAYTTLLYSHLAETNGNKEFVAAYTKKYGAPPSPLAGCGYVSIQIAIEGLKKAGVDSSQEELKAAIMELKLDTVHGPLSFNKWRVATFTSPIVKVDKEFVPRIVREYRVKSEVVNNKFVYSLE